jgi:hypothetical protein
VNRVWTIYRAQVNGNNPKFGSRYREFRFWPSQLLCCSLRSALHAIVHESHCIAPPVLKTCQTGEAEQVNKAEHTYEIEQRGAYLTLSLHAPSYQHTPPSPRHHHDTTTDAATDTTTNTSTTHLLHTYHIPTTHLRHEDV